MHSNDQNDKRKDIQQTLIDHFPQQPYSVQINIAKLLHQTLQDQKIKLAIIESPTGTGKTYSLLVPLIVWLKNNRTKAKPQQQVEKKSTLPAWLKKPSQQMVEKLFSQKKKRIQKAISITQAQDQLKKLRLKHASASLPKEEQQIQLDQEDEGNFRSNFKRQHQHRMEMMVEKQLKVEDQTALPKIIFISRTHSQLAQVIQSIKLITDKDESLKCLEVASKQHLCINPTINTNKSNISQRCQYILDHSKCDFFHNLTIKQFFNSNIEDASQLGTAHHLCPYYATRNLIEQCDIICLPYASILNSDIRNRIGINIHNAILVFDEGHNVIDNQKQLHSPQILIEDVIILSQQVDQYTKKYEERLKISNYKLLLHFLDILRVLVATMEKYRSERSKQIEEKKYLKVKYLDFIGQMAIKELKIFKIIKYMQLNNIDQKLAHFHSTLEKDKKHKKYEDSKISVGKINNILRFLQQFGLFNEEKQILLLKWGETKKGAIKILCLSSEQLQKIIQRSRLTIVAGGTMEPLDDFVPLFDKMDDKYLVKKYLHIINKDQCSVTIIRKSMKKDIIFNHQTTNDSKHVQQLKQICLNAVNRIIKKTQKGGGIVVFIQNYRLITFFRQIFKHQPYYSRMLFDGKDNQQQTNNKDIFQMYKQLVQKDQQNSYILFSVMGGKLSEGINFSDRLARSLIVFGLPYANIYAPQVVQTINHIQQGKKSTKKEYLQSMCMRTLNQTIGRGVRHIKDYVNIYLIDARFEGIRHKLSQWMRDRVIVVNDIDQL